MALAGWLGLSSALLGAATDPDGTRLVGKPVVGKNADGHLEVFKVEADGELRHRWQKLPGGSWSGWSSLGGSVLPGVAITTNLHGELEVFAIARSSLSLCFIRQATPNSPDWSGWTNLGGALQPPLALARDTAGRLNLFAVAAQGGGLRHLWQVAADGTWSTWADRAGHLLPGVIAARNRDGRLELFGLDANHSSLVHCWQRVAGESTNWSDWADLGGSIQPGFVAGQNNLGRLEVFAVNRTNSRVERICQAIPSQSANWLSWANFSGPVMSRPASSSNTQPEALQREETAATVDPGLALGQSADGRLEILAVAQRNGLLLHRWETLVDGSDIWSAWTSLGKAAQPVPAVARNEDGDLEVFALDRQRPEVINHRRQISNASDWLDWSSLDQPTFQYNSRSWQTDEGLPHNLVQAITQTRDGFLWVGTREGLARFDGISFASFDAKNTPAILNSSITALCASRTGTLWIGTDGGGLVSLKEGRFSRFAATNGLAGDTIRAIYETGNGTLWIGTTTGLSRYRDGKFTNYSGKDGLVSNLVRAIYEDRDRNLWLATGAGLNRLHDQAMDSFVMPNGLPNDSVRAICQDQGGRIWIGSNNGMLWYNWFWTKNFYAYNTRYGLSDTFVSAICEDPEGNLWVGTYSGLNRFHEGRFLTERDNQGQPFGKVNALFADGQGNLWVGLDEGLVRLTPRRFTTYTLQQGLSHNNIMSVLEDRKGNLWVGTWGGGLDRCSDERVRSYATSDELSRNLVLALAEGSDGSLWVGADYDGGLSRLKDGQITRYTWKNGLLKDAVRVVHEDAAGTLWIGTGQGLCALQNGRFTNYTAKDGLSGEAVHAICEDHAGTLWIGTEAGLYRRQDGHFSRFTTANGLSANSVRALYEDKAQNLWIGTGSGGLNRYRSGHFSAYTTTQGLFSDEILDILEDDQGSLWMSCSQGVFRVHKRDLDELDRGAVSSLTSLAYGRTDGMETPQCNGSAKPGAWKSRDGRLWFATSKGLSVVDPATIRIDANPPPVYLQQVLADKKPLLPPLGKTPSHPGALATASGVASLGDPGGSPTAPEFGRQPAPTAPAYAPSPPREERAGERRPLSISPPNSGPVGGSPPDTRHAAAPLEPSDNGGNPGRDVLSIPPGQGDLELRFTALDLTAPESIRFKYRLEGVDADWIDAGTRRIAYYSHLNPGKYRFEVIARNKDGVWNQAGASLNLVLEPHIWQIWWLRALAGLLLLGAASGTARYATKRRMQRKLELLERRHALEKERGRIAKDIHDDLGSSLTRIMMLGERAAEGLTRSEDVRPHVDKIVSSARRTVEALDEIVWAVNPTNDTLEGLVEYISHYADEFFENTNVSCRLEIPATLPAFTLEAEVRHDLFLVVKEAFNNIIKHSGATRVSVQVSATADALQIIIEDNGCGLPADPKAPGRKGNGLANMRKRIEGLRGQASFAGASPQGARLQFSVPLRA